MNEVMSVRGGEDLSQMASKVGSAMLTLRGWLWGLWGWWVLSTVFLLGITSAGWYYSVASYEAQFSNDLLPKARALQDTFMDASLDAETAVTDLELHHVATPTELTPEVLEKARHELKPWVHLYYVYADGRPVLSHDAPAPYDLTGLVANYDRFEEDEPRLEDAEYDPMPARGKSFRIKLDRFPPDFHATLQGITRPPHATYVLGDVDLGYLFGPYLQEQCTRLGLPGTASRLDHQILWSELPPDLVANAARMMAAADKLPQHPVPQLSMPSGLGILLHPDTARWTCRITVIRQIMYPGDAVELSGGLPADLIALRQSWILVDAGCLAVILGFAVSLRLAGTAVARDMANAHIRANFTALVSHELKTPVAAMCLTTEILKHKLVDDAATLDEYHDQLHDDALRLKRLIENVMRLLGVGQKPKLDSMPIASLVEQALAEAAEGVPVATDLSQASLVLADREAAVRSIANLVQNACKYGGDSADIQVVAHESGAHVQVDVMDRGPGIPRRLRQAVFEPYFRIQDENRREKPGTGLGLALVKVCMERQGGSVSILDRPGGGSIFRLQFRRP